LSGLVTDSAAEDSPGNTERLRRRNRRSSALHQVPWFLAVPAVTLMLVLRYFPSFAGGFFAFTNWTGGSLWAHWIGLENFRLIFSNSTTEGALWHTLELAGLLVVCTNVFGLALAIGLKSTLKSRNILRSLFFLPFALSQVTTAFIWQFMLEYNGPINVILRGVGLGRLQEDWLANPHFALFAVAACTIWQYVGFTMVLYLAGLQGISDELDDAVSVDGASAWLKFRRVTLPLLAPAMTVSATLTLIFGLGAFDQVIALTGGGPVSATETLATQVYEHTFEYGQFGFGAAFSLILAGLVTVLALAQMVILRARESRM
jgi:raffinose/stachyose/melibiose transport system permease protein